ncbi:protein phosphatase Slingshot homolog 2b [Aplochiton taeniatus]
MALVTVQRSPTPSTSSSPCVSESGSGEDDRRSQPRSISESFLTVKGAALFLPRGNGSSPSSTSRFAQLRSKHAGDLQQHLQTMFTLLRPEDNIKLAVRLESVSPPGTRYMVVVSTNGRQDTEESVVLGMDFSPTDSSCSVGLVLPLWSDTLIHLDGDGGFSVSTDSRIHVFKPVSVQAMWSALQSLHKACEVARCHNYYPGSLFLTWVSYYQSRVSSDQSRINEWNAMQDVQTYRADSPVLFSDVPTERERTERLIKTRLREIMMQKDLENVTSKEIRTELEMHMVCNLREFKEFIDNEMIVILGQMDSPTEIFDHVYLGSEWNASNLEELQNSGVQYILNVTREIDNFFPGLFEYHNIRVYDEEATNLLEYWNDTYKFISRAKRAGAKCLVHCKMGVSRSASTVIAYAMKEYGWDLERAFHYVKERRAVTKPNPSFMRQLEEYQGILLASKQRHNKLWRSHSDSDLSEHHEPLCKPPAQPHTLGRSDPRNHGNAVAPSLEELLQPLGTPPSRARHMVQSSSLPGCGDQAEKLTLSSPGGTSSGQSTPTTEHPPRARSGSAVAQLQEELQELGRLQPQGAERFTAANHVTMPSPPLSPRSPPLSNGLCSSEEDPPPSVSPLPLPRPRAATVVVPGVSPATVAEAVPQQQLIPMPQSVPESSSSRTPPLSTTSSRAGHPELPIPVPDKKADCKKQQQQRLSLDASGPQTAAHWSGGEQLHSPNAPSQLAGTDHINFFSAREKFQGLAQDGRSRGGSVCAQAGLPTAQNRGPTGQDLQSLPQQDLTGEREEEEEIQKESVSLLYAVAPPHGPLSQSGSQVPQGKEASGAKQEVKESQEDVPHIKDEEELDAGCPGTLSSDWTRGSVRRVTRQLEQRIKQEPFISPSPPSLSLGAACPPRHPHSPEHSPSTSLSQLNSNPQDASGFNSFHRPSSVDFLCLEGVTELESGTEWDSLSEGPRRADLITPETWETLHELGAFLQQVSGATAADGARAAGGARAWPRAVTQGWDGSEGPGAVQRKGGRGGGQRAREKEARIRQAGLTPPSLMKRSASLAKLGCLELLANDLSDWELSRASMATPVMEPLPQVASDESSKKQRVHSTCPSSSLAADQSEHSKAPLSNQSGPLPDSSHAPSQLPGLVSVATRQQYGRTHPLRRLKKRTVGTLYHTM